MQVTSPLPTTETATGILRFPEDKPASRPRMLVVDDEEGPRVSLRVIFQDDFDIELSEDGPRAIERVKNAMRTGR